MSETFPEYDGPGYATCLWPVDPGCYADRWFNDYDEAQQERALALASSSLTALVGNRVSNCPVKVRPCKRSACSGFIPYQGPSGPGWGPSMDVLGNWVNSCGCASSCGCGAVCEISLPAPVGRIDEVKVDGVVIDPSDYRVDNGHLLVWQGSGTCPWPAWQDLSKPDTEPDTFSVTYLNAYPVDRGGAQAVATLALEFAVACGGGGMSCRLPGGVTQVVRQGLTYTVNPGLFPDGFTGIREVDGYIMLWNPRNLRQDSTMWAPGAPSIRRTTLG